MLSRPLFAIDPPQVLVDVDDEDAASATKKLPGSIYLYLPMASNAPCSIYLGIN